ncbi:hypothetical protein [Sphingomonas arenae]|uniref:hypothetical protein n=1 Tax=Sphingomonas arenae TaxID=2812555 RepID=UPI0019684EE5|nr:hypothetical protein [Sphingomonas arenae]
MSKAIGKLKPSESGLTGLRLSGVFCCASSLPYPQAPPENPRNRYNAETAGEFLKKLAWPVPRWWKKGPDPAQPDLRTAPELAFAAAHS